MIAFIGLGNVEPEYAATKHNFGFWVVDELARRWGLSFRPGRGHYVYAEHDFMVSGEKTPAVRVVVAKPTVGMNQSGIGVKEIQEAWNLALADLHIIVDDVDLPLGVLRIRPMGGDASHRGMASVIYHLGSTHFPRIRLGIATSEPLRPAERYVLRPFRRKDESRARDMIVRGAEAVESILCRGLEKTMSEFNRIAGKEKMV
ncbi:MAG: aminoacyl-tRNA hydrolase [Fidelibacterota bacterium]